MHEIGHRLVLENEDLFAATQLPGPGQSVERECCQHGQALKAAFVVLVELAAIGLVRQLEEGPRL